MEERKDTCLPTTSCLLPFITLKEMEEDMKEGMGLRPNTLTIPFYYLSWLTVRRNTPLLTVNQLKKENKKSVRESDGSYLSFHRGTTILYSLSGERWMDDSSHKAV